jgi:hypothetical protein
MFAVLLTLGCESEEIGKFVHTEQVTRLQVKTDGEGLVGIKLYTTSLDICPSSSQSLLLVFNYLFSHSFPISTVFLIALLQEHLSSTLYPNQRNFPFNLSPIQPCVQ